MRKFEKLRGHKTKDFEFIQKIKSENPKLFVYWTRDLGLLFKNRCDKAEFFIDLVNKVFLCCKKQNLALYSLYI